MSAGFDKLRRSGVSDQVRDARGYREYPKGQRAGSAVVFEADARLAVQTYRGTLPLTDDQRATVKAATREAARVERVERAAWKRRGLGRYDWAYWDHLQRVETTLAALDIPTETRAYRTWVETAAGLSSGLVMPKRSVFGPADAYDVPDWVRRALPEFDAPLAQLRPDAPLPTKERPYWHDHDGTPPHLGDARWPDVPTVTHGPRRWPMGQRRRLAHEIKEHYHPDTGELLVPLDGLHYHRPTAKYKLPPGPSARRLDCLPMLPDGTLDPVAYFGRADLFWFVLEGCLKSDALVSWAADRGLAWGVWNTPSVTTWGGGSWMDADGEAALLRELDAFAWCYLRQRADRPPVIIVADSDWSDPAKGIYQVADVDDPRSKPGQANRVADVLASHGVPVVMVAPPEGDYAWTRPDGRDVHVKRGLDDWVSPLGCAASPLDMVTAADWQPSEAYAAWVESTEAEAAMSRSLRQRQARRRETAAADAFLAEAMRTRDHQVKLDLIDAARVFETGREATVRETVDRLVGTVLDSRENARKRAARPSVWVRHDMIEERRQTVRQWLRDVGRDDLAEVPT